jgi:hypothetical protein
MRASHARQGGRRAVDERGATPCLSTFSKKDWPLALRDVRPVAAYGHNPPPISATKRGPRRYFSLLAFQVGGRYHAFLGSQWEATEAAIAYLR